MSWIQKLYDSYDACKANAVGSEARVWPISHFVKRAHVEVVLDGNGVFRRARKLERSEAPTLIPATEASAGRTSGMAAHPLCEELSYCASDLPNREERRFSEYSQKLRQWCTSPQAHPKAQAVLAYATTGTLWADLNQGQLLPMYVEDVRGNKTKVADDKVFVRWRVEVAGDPCSGTWEDRELIDRWTLFDKNTNARSGFCMVTGTQQRLSQNHPRFIRSSGDGGKLISANDFDGYTFRGKFTDGKLDYEKQTCSVGFEVSQKAHNALRWLIARQGSRNGDQVIVCWAVSGKPVPDPLAGTYELLGIEHNPESAIAEGANAGQAFALRLNKAIAGYKANLDPTEEVVVMGLDSATPGRLAITYYRELRGSELLATSSHGT